MAKSAGIIIHCDDGDPRHPHEANWIVARFFPGMGGWIAHRTDPTTGQALPQITTILSGDTPMPPAATAVSAMFAAARGNRVHYDISCSRCTLSVSVNATTLWPALGEMAARGVSDIPLAVLADRLASKPPGRK